MRIIEKLQNMLARLTWQQAFHFIIASFFVVLLACFFDWLIINWMSGCCEGGICIPEWLYPQCINHDGSHAE
jgi:hypothetical protein